MVNLCYQIKLKQITIFFSIGALISLIWIWIYLIYMGKNSKNYALIFTILLSALTFALYIILSVSLAQIILYRVYKNKKPLTEELGNISNSLIGQ